MIFLNDKDLENKVVVDKDEYADLEDRLFFLQCLEACGVDNWEGYDEAVEMYNKDQKMMCYRDRTFCPFFSSCSDAAICNRALTDEVKAEAKKWWGPEGEAPICIYLDKPKCYIEREKGWN